MRTFKTVSFVMAAILFASLVLTCKKENDKSVAADNEVAFAINISNLKSAPALKSAMDYNLANADKIVLTIQNNDGSPTKYTSSEVKIQQMNGIYYTQKIVLKTGNYRLTEFLILNAADSTIFATPLTGYPEAQNVSNPLPIAFSVAKDITTPVNVEVLSTEKKKPEDFGLGHFPIIEVKTFSFLAGVTDKESDKLLSAKITVSNGTYSYIKNLDSVVNNVVTVKDGLSNYTLTVEKSGYKTYTHTYSIDSMKMFKDTVGNLPLLIELENSKITTDGLVAYYPFNGNANDESGNANNGTINGATLTTDRFGKPNKAYSFDGINNFIQIPTGSFNTQKGTVTTWFKINGIPNSETTLLSISNKNESSSSEFFLGFDQRAGTYNEEIEAVVIINGQIAWYLMVPESQFDCRSNFNWNFVTLTQDGITPKLYLNGQQVGDFHPAHLDYSKWWSDLFSASIPADNSKIGGWSRNNLIDLFNGVIDDMRIYNRALNEQEIQELYNEGK